MVQIDMKMPTSCKECRFMRIIFSDLDNLCNCDANIKCIVNDTELRTGVNAKSEYCPLKEVKEQ